MVKEVTLDSSVLVSAFVKGDKFRAKARRIIEKVFSGEFRVVTSAIVFVEVCGSVARRVGVDKALLVKDQLVKWDNMNFIGWSELTGKRMGEAAELAVELKLRGMDAIVVQVAKEKKRALITFDEEMAEKAKAAVEVFTH
ncbi:MAG: type II toxin-antitoxin system VapC family toxin [Candidatus Bathyarchaeota archaeon]|nr:type II toxin-antitoxin system VapC family toxin [Candidatus Bathyarchaeota archaeon]